MERALALDQAIAGAGPLRWGRRDAATNSDAEDQDIVAAEECLAEIASGTTTYLEGEELHMSLAESCGSDFMRELQARHNL